jgi:hypothetical protein
MSRPGCYPVEVIISNISFDTVMNPHQTNAPQHVVDMYDWLVRQPAEHIDYELDRFRHTVKLTVHFNDQEIAAKFKLFFG